MFLRPCALTLALLLPCATAGAAGYELVDLQALAASQGHRLLEVSHLNNRGEIAGTINVSAERGSYNRGFVLRDGVLQVLHPGAGARTGSFSHASAVNDAGVVVGYGEFSRTANPAIWEPGQPPREVQLPGRFASAKGISGSGVIVGAYTPDKSAVAFVYERGEFRPIEPLGVDAKGLRYSEAHHVNDKGQVVGRTSSAEGEAAFLWQGGKTTLLPPLRAHAGQEPTVHAYGINAAGQAVGCSSSKRLKETLPVIWDTDGSVRPLFDPRRTDSGASYACAKAINAHGVVVGEAWGPGGGGAFRWDAKSGYSDLRTIADPFEHGWRRLREAIAINDRGEIIGVAEGNDELQLKPYLLRACEGWRCSVPGRRARYVLAGVLAAALAAALAWRFVRARKRRA